LKFITGNCQSQTEGSELSLSDEVGAAAENQDVARDPGRAWRGGGNGALSGSADARIKGAQAGLQILVVLKEMLDQSQGNRRQVREVVDVVKAFAGRRPMPKGSADCCKPPLYTVVMAVSGKPHPNPPLNQPPRRRIRSFVRRAGRMTSAQQRAINEFWPHFGVDMMGERFDPEELFANGRPVVLDIGFGDGDALRELAEANPDINYLGVEVYEPGIGHLLLGLDAAGINNVRVMCADAAELLSECLPAACLTAVNLFFPDPWPKKRHFKRRLVQAPFVVDVARTLRPSGLFHMATDWLPYAEHVQQLMAGFSGLQPISASQAIGGPMAQRPLTKFERRGRALGHSVTDLYYRKV
jgi:tRNA (guanine-N7-)-methyltransferase